jgi:hypothetical protein
MVMGQGSASVLPNLPPTLDHDAIKGNRIMIYLFV